MNGASDGPFVRRAFLRPAALGATVSLESLVIAGLIATLMVTFLLTWRLDELSTGGRVNWWLHAIVILSFLALIAASKHFHLLLSPLTVLRPRSREPSQQHENR